MNQRHSKSHGSPILAAIVIVLFLIYFLGNNV